MFFFNFKIFLDEFIDHEVVKTWPKPVLLSQNGTRFKSGYFPNTQETEISIAPKSRVKRAVSLKFEEILVHIFPRPTNTETRKLSKMASLEISGQPRAPYEHYTTIVNNKLQNPESGSSS